MHELAVTESILAIALKHATAAGAARITDVHLVIGELSSFIDESMQFYWDIITADSPAAGATLHFQRVPAKMRCRDCQHEFASKQALPCPACGGTLPEILAGTEFYVAAIDVTGAPAALGQ